MGEGDRWTRARARTTIKDGGAIRVGAGNCKFQVSLKEGRQGELSPGWSVLAEKEESPLPAPVVKMPKREGLSRGRKIFVREGELRDGKCLWRENRDWRRKTIFPER